MMKHKLIISLIFIFVNTLNINSQSTLDIVRASNYYSKAITAYRGSSYNSALSHLKNAETNLKGKTNKDLEYLKIMTYYKLKNYPKAYGLVQIYFEKGYPKEKTQYFKNIESYRKRYNTDYDKDLTNIFIELEDKYGVVTNTSIDDVISSIIKRIKAKKQSLANFIDNNTKSSAKIFVYDYRSKKFRQGYGGYDYGKRKSKYIYLNKKSVNKSDNYAYYRTSSSNMNSVCSVRVYFNENNSVNKSSYKYSFTYSRNYVKESSCIEFPYQSQIWNGSSYEDVGGFSSIPRNTAKIKMKKNKYYYNRTKTFYVEFSDTESLILEQADNMGKLKSALSKNSLL